jgi:hypothetical protein
MEALSGPVTVACVLLSLGGLAKVVRPVPTAGALRALHLPGTIPAVRVLGSGELALGAAAALSGSSLLVGLVALAYLAFAAFVLAARRAGTDIQSCGCLGTVDTPPSLVHVVVNLGFAAVTGIAALVGVPGLVTVLADQPAFGLPYVLLVVVTTYLVYLALAVLPLALHAGATDVLAPRREVTS